MTQAKLNRSILRTQINSQLFLNFNSCQPTYSSHNDVSPFSQPMQILNINANAVKLKIFKLHKKSFEILDIEKMQINCKYQTLFHLVFI